MFGRTRASGAGRLRRSGNDEASRHLCGHICMSVRLRSAFTRRTAGQVFTHVRPSATLLFCAWTCNAGVMYRGWSLHPHGPSQGGGGSWSAMSRPSVASPRPWASTVTREKVRREEDEHLHRGSQVQSPLAWGCRGQDDQRPSRLPRRSREHAGAAPNASRQKMRRRIFSFSDDHGLMRLQRLPHTPTRCRISRAL